jgi:hypothetical protein
MCVLVGDFMGEEYMTNSLLWMVVRTSVREMFKGEACTSG